MCVCTRRVLCVESFVSSSDNLRPDPNRIPLAIFHVACAMCHVPCPMSDVHVSSAEFGSIEVGLGLAISGSRLGLRSVPFRAVPCRSVDSFIYLVFFSSSII